MEKQEDSTISASPVQPQEDQDESPAINHDENSKSTAPTKVEQEFSVAQLFAVVGTITMACFIMLLDTSIMATAVPKITTDFHSLGDVGWYGSGYLLANCALQPTTGKLYTRFHSKYTFMSFLAVFELGSLLCAVSTSSHMLIVGRAVAGLGGSGLTNGALTIISVCVPLHKRATYLGFIMSVAQLGVMLGPLIGGALTQYVSWRWCFWINLPAGGVIGLVLIFINIPDGSSKKAKPGLKETINNMDLPGFFLFGPTATMCLLALQWGGTAYPWHSATIIGLFCGSAGNLALFMIWEYRKGDQAMIPWSLIRRRIVWTACLFMLFFFGGQIMNSYYLAIYFQAVKGVTPTLSGVYLLPSILSQVLFSMVSGVLVGRLGYYLPWAVISGILMSIGYGLMSTFNPMTSTGTWIGYQIIAGAGRGCGLQMPLVAVQNAIPAEQNPVAMSLVAFFQIFGGALFLSFAQTDFSTSVHDGLRKFAPEISPQQLTTAGASGFRTLLHEDSIAGVIETYSFGVSHVFYIGTGAAIACVIFSSGIGWKSVKKPKVTEPQA